MVDKWFLILFLFVVLSSVSTVYVRRQDVDKKEQSRDNPSADDFEILE